MQALLGQLQHGQVAIRLCPRAALTGETPCGHYVRVWAVAAPCGTAGAGPCALVSASGHVLSGLMSGAASSRLNGGFRSSASGNVLSSRALALPGSGNLRNRSALLHLPTSVRSRGAGSGLLRTSSMGPSLSSAGALRQSGAVHGLPRGRRGVAGGLLRNALLGTGKGAGGGPGGAIASGRVVGINPLLGMRATETSRTSAANLPAAVSLAQLFTGAAAAGGTDGDGDDEPLADDPAPPLLRGSGGGGRGAPLLRRAPATAPVSPAQSGAGGGAIVSSAYIDGTLPAGGALGTDGRFLDASIAGLRPAATHGFDQVISGVAAGFGDVLEASAEAARAACVVFVDEACPSVLEVREGGQGQEGAAALTRRQGGAGCADEGASSTGAAAPAHE